MPRPQILYVRGNDWGYRETDRTPIPRIPGLLACYGEVTETTEFHEIDRRNSWNWVVVELTTAEVIPIYTLGYVHGLGIPTLALRWSLDHRDVHRLPLSCIQHIYSSTDDLLQLFDSDFGFARAQ